MAREFDSPWKQTLATLFEAFIQFFFPGLHGEIDWSEPPVALDQELQSISREGETGETRVDNLTRVKLKTGAEAWLYVHVEVQSQYDAGLPERIFSYHIRLFDRYGRHPVNLVVLGDEAPAWRPTEYDVPHLGRAIRLPFLSVKLLDLADRLDELERHENPVGLIVAAHLESLFTGKEPSLRLAAKLRLMRRLLERGAGPDDIRAMYRLIDWFLDLPREQTQEFRAGMAQIEEEMKMPRYTMLQQLELEEAEEKGAERGLRQGLELALAARFDAPGRDFARQKLGKLDINTLQRIVPNLLKADSLDEATRLLESTT